MGIFLKILKYWLLFCVIFGATFFGFKACYSSQFYQENIAPHLALAKKGEMQFVLGEKVGEVSESEECSLSEEGPTCGLKMPEIKIIQPVLKNDASSTIEISGSSAVAIELESGKTLFNKLENEIRPIASITKLMTALVFLDHNPGWDSEYVMLGEDRREGGRVHLFLGDKITVKDLFNLSLIASDNTATIALVKSTGLSEENFVNEMNLKANFLGLVNTNFADPVGLSDKNTSTALEVSKLAKTVLANREIQEATISKNYIFQTKQGRKVKVESTDLLLKNLPPNGLRIEGGKTGYTESAGYCFVGKFKNQSGREVIATVLNSATYQTRFSEAKKIAEWVFESYEWK